MQKILLILLILAGLCATTALAATAFIAHSQEVSDGPLLVVTLPWGPDPAEVVAAAGGYVVSPARAPLAVVAAGASAATLNRAGAFAVLDATAASFLCGAEEDK